MKIIPYVQIDGAWSLPDSVMSDLWARMTVERTVQKVFCTGSIKSQPEFMHLVKSPSNCVVTQWYGDEPVFLGWLNNFTKKSAMAHFCVFKGGWGWSEEILKSAFKYWFSFKNYDGDPLLDTLIGMIGADNRLAVKLSKKVGSVDMGVIPNYAVNYYTKETIGLYVCYMQRQEVESWEV